MATLLDRRATAAALSSTWTQFKQDGSARARDFIIEHYRYLITKTRQRTIPSVPAKIAPEDLEQEGMMALVKAVDQFDPSRNVKFESYAISIVRGAMLEYLRKEDWVPRSVRTKEKLLARAEEALALTKGEEITDEDRAEFLELDIDQFYALSSAATVRYLVSLETVLGDPDHEDLSPIVVMETISSPDPDPYLTTVTSEQRRRLRQWVNWLPEAERNVIRLYYHEGRTLKQIAKEIERSDSRAHQLHSQAIGRLQQFSAGERAFFVGPERAGRPAPTDRKETPMKLMETNSPPGPEASNGHPADARQEVPATVPKVEEGPIPLSEAILRACRRRGWTAAEVPRSATKELAEELGVDPRAIGTTLWRLRGGKRGSASNGRPPAPRKDRPTRPIADAPPRPESPPIAAAAGIADARLVGYAPIAAAAASVTHVMLEAGLESVANEDLQAELRKLCLAVLAQVPLPKA